MDIKQDYEIAALNLFPEDWMEFENGFRIDQNANIRKAVEPVFKHVFESLRFDEDLSVGVASAFLRRMGNYAPSTEYDKKVISSYMSTALEYAIIKIRDGK